jgi:hypothetical protein
VEENIFEFKTHLANQDVVNFYSAGVATVVELVTGANPATSEFITIPAL